MEVFAVGAFAVFGGALLQLFVVDPAEAASFILNFLYKYLGFSRYNGDGSQACPVQGHAYEPTPVVKEDGYPGNA